MIAVAVVEMVSVAAGQVVEMGSPLPVVAASVPEIDAVACWLAAVVQQDIEAASTTFDCLACRPAATAGDREARMEDMVAAGGHSEEEVCPSELELQPVGCRMVDSACRHSWAGRLEERDLSWFCECAAVQGAVRFATKDGTCLGVEATDRAGIGALLHCASAAILKVCHA